MASAVFCMGIPPPFDVGSTEVALVGTLADLPGYDALTFWRGFWSWLRTMKPDMPPSELVVANALRSSLPEFFAVSDSVPGLEKIMTVYHRYSSPSEHWAATLAVG